LAIYLMPPTSLAWNVVYISGNQLDIIQLYLFRVEVVVVVVFPWQSIRCHAPPPPTEMKRSISN
jgi:hypothetical protein